MAMNPGAIRIVQGAGHMGPITHRDAVVRMTVQNIEASDPMAWYRH
jgi:hypothetical protein